MMAENDEKFDITEEAIDTALELNDRINGLIAKLLKGLERVESDRIVKIILPLQEQRNLILSWNDNAVMAAFLADGVLVQDYKAGPADAE